MFSPTSNEKALDRDFFFAGELANGRCTWECMVEP
jgi:hypothetical protein